MSTTAYKELSEQVNMLSFTDRLRLLEQIAQTLQIQDEPKAKVDSEAFDKAFGLWRNRDVDLKMIRAKAWGRSN